MRTADRRTRVHRQVGALANPPPESRHRARICQRRQDGTPILQRGGARGRVVLLRRLPASEPRSGCAASCLRTRSGASRQSIGCHSKPVRQAPGRDTPIRAPTASHCPPCWRRVPTCHVTSRALTCSRRLLMSRLRVTSRGGCITYLASCGPVAATVTLQPSPAQTSCRCPSTNACLCAASDPRLGCENEYTLEPVHAGVGNQSWQSRGDAIWRCLAREDIMMYTILLLDAIVIFVHNLDIYEDIYGVISPPLSQFQLISGIFMYRKMLHCETMCPTPACNIPTRRSHIQ